ncbi:MAG: glycosyltransferase family 4 protein [Xanthomonadales bacterium]|nr:glycosyltransferase family 4 protein [Xanthomonadales bacterium]
MSQLTLPIDTYSNRVVELSACRSKQLNVIHVPRRFVRNEWGGTETTILETCRALNARGHSSSIVTTTALCDRKHEKMQDVEIHRHNYVYPFLGLSEQDKRDMDRKGGNLLSLSMLKTLLSTPGIDVLHAHSGKRLGGIVRTAARLRKLPYVISLHGGVIDVPAVEQEQMLVPLKGAFEWGRAFGAMLGARRVLEDASAIICVGQNEQRAVQARYPGKRVEWLPNGVNAESFSEGNGRAFREKNGIPHNRRVILNVGRIDPQKDQLSLLSAMAELIRKHSDIHLVLIGPVTVESYGAELLNKINSAALYNHVTVLPGLPGGSEELVNAFHAADIFCLPSRHEPFGIVVLEAWAAGLPVVASCVGGIPSFTSDGVDVLHADAGKPESFSNAIDRLLCDPELGRQIAGNGRAKARTQFDWAQVTDRLEAIYRDLLRA